MGSVADESAHRCLRLPCLALRIIDCDERSLNLREHPVQRDRQSSDLCLRRPVRDTLVQMATGDPPCGLFHLVERLQCAPDEEQAGRGDRGEDQQADDDEHRRHAAHDLRLTVHRQGEDRDAPVLVGHCCGTPGSRRRRVSRRRDGDRARRLGDRRDVRQGIVDAVGTGGLACVARQAPVHLGRRTLQAQLVVGLVGVTARRLGDARRPGRTVLELFIDPLGEEPLHHAGHHGA